MDTIIAFHLAWIGFGMILMVYAVFCVAKEGRKVGEIADNTAAMTREVLNRVSQSSSKQPSRCPAAGSQQILSANASAPSGRPQSRRLPSPQLQS